MTRTVLYIGVFYANNKLGITYIIDINYFIEQGAHLLNNAFQEGIHILNNTFSNGSNINIPKFKEAFDITKPTILDLSKTTLDNTGVWDKIIKNPRPFIYSGPNLYNIPFLGVGLGIISIIVNNGLGFNEKIWNDLDKSIKKLYGSFLHTKSYINKIWNEGYINSIIENFGRNFLLFSSSINNNMNDSNNENILDNNDSDNDNDHNILDNNDSDNDNDHNILDNNSSDEGNSENTLDNNTLSQSGIITNTTITDYNLNLQERINLNSINSLEDFNQDLITSQITTLVGRVVNLNWDGLNPILNVTNMPMDSWRPFIERDDTLYDHYSTISDIYLEEESFQLRVDFGTNSMSDNFLDVGNLYDIIIYDFDNNWRGLNFFITFLEVEIESMQEAHESLINGNTDVELFIFNGQIGMTWEIHDFNHLLDIYQDFDTQLNRKLIVLQFLKSILSHMESTH